MNVPATPSSLHANVDATVQWARAMADFIAVRDAIGIVKGGGWDMKRLRYGRTHTVVANWLREKLTPAEAGLIDEKGYLTVTDQYEPSMRWEFTEPFNSFYLSCKGQTWYQAFNDVKNLRITGRHEHAGDASP